MFIEKIISRLSGNEYCHNNRRVQPCVCVPVSPHAHVYAPSTSTFKLVHMRVREGLVCVDDVYLSEQLFQRERISASVIASAIFSLWTLSLSLSYSVSHFSLLSIFSLNFVLSPPADFLSGCHSSFISLLYSPQLLVLGINCDPTVSTIRWHAHTYYT